jgi:hypothetical protein
MKTIQVLSKLTARELGKPEKECDDVNDFFWKAVRRKLSNMETASVSLKHIGTITTSKRKIDQYIKVTINKIRNLRKSIRYKESTREILLDVNFDRLRKALVQRNKLAIQYHEAYLKRASRIREADAVPSEELGIDLGGHDEPSEVGVQHAPGGGTSGDSKTEIHLCAVPVQQQQCGEQRLQDG